MKKNILGAVALASLLFVSCGDKQEEPKSMVRSKNSNPEAIAEKEAKLAAEKEEKMANHKAKKEELAGKYAATLESQEDGLYAVFVTNKGDIVVKLEADKVPMTVANFVGLAEGDMASGDVVVDAPFYDGLKFHRVIADFMIQGGDPMGTGQGGPGYAFEDEFDPSLKHNGPGVLSMANSGPATNGSQFFITHKETPWLDGKHSVFGNVIVGLDVVNAIAQGDEMEYVVVLPKGEEWMNYNPKEIFTEIQASAAQRSQEKLKKGLANSGIKAKGELKFTDSGLGYVVNEEGTGPQVKVGQNVVMHYSGYLMDGTKFDSSVDRDEPFPVENIGNAPLIKGWNEGVPLFKVGSKGLLVIPSELGYGARGAGGSIPPNADLIFEIEVISAE